MERRVAGTLRALGPFTQANGREGRGAVVTYVASTAWSFTTYAETIMFYRYCFAGMCLLSVGGAIGCMGDVQDQKTEEIGGAEGMSDEAEQALVQATCNYSVAGKYCYNDGITNGVVNGLYSCPGGVGSPATLVQTCTYGCKIMPSGTNDVCNPPPPTPIVITSDNLAVFNNGVYDGNNRLLWNDSGTKYGGNRFSNSYKTSVTINNVAYTRVNAYGDTTGQCVSLVKSLSGRTGATSGWSKGLRAVDSCASVSIGTAVATFSGSIYSGHTGFLCGCSASAITLCDQNYASPTDGLVRRHSLSKTGTNTVSDAGAYYVVLSSN